MKRNHFALIMAGGQGTRFWPWSTEARPKQFLPVIGNESLIAQTYQRLKHFIPEQNIYIVADPRYRAIVAESIPGFSTANYIAEPSPRNTAPCLMLANIVLSRLDPEATLLVTPADHFIGDVEAYAAQMTAALVMAESRCIITAGIPPESPHTGYGYIHCRKSGGRMTENENFSEVLEFKEKPDRKTAEAYVREGSYFWNSGQFIYKLSNFRDFLMHYAPDYFQGYQELERTYALNADIAGVFNSIRPDSIDYVLMEKAADILMMRARFDWNDVGSWTSVYEMNRPDQMHNVVRGEPILVDTKDCLAFSIDGRPLALIGLEDIAVVATEHGVLVARKGELQRVKEVVQRIQKVDKDSIKKI